MMTKEESSIPFALWSNYYYFYGTNVIGIWGFHGSSKFKSGLNSITFSFTNFKFEFQAEFACIRLGTRSS